MNFSDFFLSPKHVRASRTRTEVLDPKPMSLPVGMRKPETLAEQVARLVRGHEVQRLAQATGHETFEEADDFDIPDDPVDRNTPYEVDFDLAAVRASDHGVVAPPTSSAHTEARTRVNAFRRKPKEPSPKAPSNAPGEGDSPSSDD